MASVLVYLLISEVSTELMIDGTTMLGERQIGHGDLNIQPAVKENLDSKDHIFLSPTTSTLQFSYPLRLLIPDHASSTNSLWVYVITYGGGLVEGDIIKLKVEVGQRCCSVLTTQSTTKVFHCLEGRITKQLMSYSVDTGGLLCILPDPAVCFKQAIYSQKQVVSLAEDANVVMLDWQTSGRMARGEMWEFTRYSTCNEILLDDELIYRDSLVLEDKPGLSVKQAMGAFQVTGTCVLLGPILKEVIEDLLLKVGKPIRYGDKYNKEMVFSISPIHQEMSNTKVIGCVLRFSTFTTSQAYEELDRILTPLFPLIGGNPFQNKF